MERWRSGGVVETGAGRKPDGGAAQSRRLGTDDSLKLGTDWVSRPPACDGARPLGAQRIGKIRRRIFLNRAAAWRVDGEHTTVSSENVDGANSCESLGLYGDRSYFRIVLSGSGRDWGWCRNHSRFLPSC